MSVLNGSIMNRSVTNVVSAVAAQLWAPKNAFRGLQRVISKNDFDIMAHPEAEWPSQQSICIFYFFLFHYSTC